MKVVSTLSNADASAREPSNRILSGLPRAELTRMMAALQLVELDAGETVQHAHVAVKHVWFPLDCLISLRAEINPGGVLEVGLAGNEGVVGIAGGRHSQDSLLSAVVQNGGRAMQIDVPALKRLLPKCPGLQRALYLSMHALMMQASQNALCSHYHLLEGRLARSLLATRDRLGTSDFHLTHEFLAHALGVRRVGVTKAATALQTRGLIRYARGAISIIDHAGLEQAACACYALDRRALSATVDEQVFK